MYTPTHYPTYINVLTNLTDRTYWQSAYLNAYEKEYNEINSQWYGLKGTMCSISLFAFTVFGSIMVATAKVDRTLAIATTILLAALGTTSAICTAIYYGTLADESARTVNSLPNRFPLRFEATFNDKRAAKRKQDDESNDGLTTSV